MEAKLDEPFMLQICVFRRHIDPPAALARVPSITTGFQPVLDPIGRTPRIDPASGPPHYIDEMRRIGPSIPSAPGEQAGQRPAVRSRTMRFVEIARLVEQVGERPATQAGRGRWPVDPPSSPALGRDDCTRAASRDPVGAGGGISPTTCRGTTDDAAAHE